MATTKPVIEDVELSDGQLDLIQKFEADYNAVDHALRKALGYDRNPPFTRVIAEYSALHPGWPDAELLRTIARVRNALVHEKILPYSYVAIPTAGIASQLSNCRERLLNPTRAIPKFERKVETVSTQDSLAKVLKLINERDYSQFPVYDGNDFRGLLTENGITRWLAHHVSNRALQVELERVCVEHVLGGQVERNNFQFAPGAKFVDDIAALFATQAMLEAVLITQDGNKHGKPLGIVTRWDILHRE